MLTNTLSSRGPPRVSWPHSPLVSSVCPQGAVVVRPALRPPCATCGSGTERGSGHTIRDQGNSNVYRNSQFI